MNYVKLGPSEGGVKRNWIRRIKRTVLLLADNQAAIKLAINPMNHPRVKHIDIQYHKLISDNALELDYIPTEEIVVDQAPDP